MKAKLVRILQIGDVHFPDGEKSAFSADKKDTAISDEFTDTFSSNTFQDSTRKMISILESEEIDFVTFMGDLTSKGCLDGYDRCLEFLSKCLRLSSKPVIDKEKILIVAGNHDVCRKTAIASPDQKFSVLSKKLKLKGFEGLTVKDLDHRTISLGTEKVELYGVNSCIGCGEKRYLPKRVRDVIDEKISDDISKAGSDADAVLEDVYEQIDTPAIHSETIGNLVNKIESLSETHLGVIIAHHNLLPQSLPRVEVYTELINSGAFRSTLSQLGKPILYLHGHIHTDPVEIVSNPINGRRPLICVSAPAFDNGFNLLEIRFDAKSRPIGCRIHFYRANESGYITKLKEVIVPFGGVPNRVLSAKLSEVASVILKKQTLTWLDLTEIPEIISMNLDTDDLSKSLTELYWHGMINIENYSREKTSWRIGSLMG